MAKYEDKIAATEITKAGNDRRWAYHRLIELEAEKAKVHGTMPAETKLLAWKRSREKARAGCKGAVSTSTRVHTVREVGGGGSRVAQTGAIKMQIISFHAAIFPEETGARNPTPSPINLELIYDDDSIVRR